MPKRTTIISDCELTKEQCVIGLSAAVGILDKWGASTEQVCSILRVSRSTHTRAKQRAVGWSVSMDSDQMQLISFVLNIHAALRVIFDNPKNFYGFVSMSNSNEFFNGRTPLEIMVQGDMISLYETYRRIDSLLLGHHEHQHSESSLVA